MLTLTHPTSAMALPSEIKQEIAGVERDINYVVYGGTLENPDETLLKRGGGKGLKLYDEIEEDSHAYAVLQKRKLAVIARPWEVKAASEKRLDKKAADLVKAQLEKKLDQLTMELLDATLKGFSVSEVMWEDSGSEIVVNEFKARDQRRFTFTPKNELRLLTRQNMVSGEAVPDRKFIRHSFGAKDGNPFGRGLGSKLYFPVWFKRQGISFWLVFCEKFGMPTAVGKYGQNATEADQKKLLNALRALAQDAGVIIPEGMDIALLEATRSSTSDLYERLIRYMDEQISEAVLGETLTTNIGSVGSKAAADTHNGVRLEVSKADSDLLSQTLNNTLCRWITDLNVPGANPPTVWRVFEEEEDLNNRSQRDKTLFDMGFKLKLEAVREIYGDYYEVVDQGDGSNENFLKNSGVDSTGQDSNFAELERAFALSEEDSRFADWLDNQFDASFAEGLIPIKGSTLLLELKDIIETVYQDGISAIPEAYLDENDDFVGIFEDRVNANLTKRLRFTLNESGIEYKLLNPGDVSNFSEDEESANFAAKTPAKKKNCTKGVSCGNGCISAKKTCRKTTEIPGKKVSELKKKVKGEEPVTPAVSKNPAKKQTKPQKSNSGFPENIDNLELVKPLGGTTGAELVRDPATGKLYVRKSGSSPEHLRNEAAADAAYEALGVNVPKHRVYETASEPVKLSEYVEGRSLAEVMQNGTESEKKKVLKELQKHFAADALLGNWDVIGAGQDNIIVGKDGKVYRVDNGGALEYRAQGARKDEQWNKYPTEIWTMRNPEINPQSAEVFGSLSHTEVVKQINSISAKKDKLLAAVPKDTRETIKGRIEEMERVAEISKTMADDQWKDEYVSNFTKHIVGIRAAGITDKLPEKFSQKSKDKDSDDYVIMLDEKGKEFDDLRGDNSTMFDVENYVNNNGGDYNIAKNWMANQSQNSWSYSAQALKYHLLKQRNKKEDDFYWHHGADVAKKNYEKSLKQDGKTEWDETISAYHAFNYELLSKADFPNKNKDGTVTLYRTEDQEVMDIYGAKVGDKDVLIKRGMAESTSLVKPVSVYGTELTEQNVPIHRIMGTYLYERKPGFDDPAFLGDEENEFVAIMDGIKFNYTGSINPDD